MLDALRGTLGTRHLVAVLMDEPIAPPLELAVDGAIGAAERPGVAAGRELAEDAVLDASSRSAMKRARSCA